MSHGTFGGRHRRARVRNPLVQRPTACGVCGHALTRRSSNHQHRCAGHAAAELFGWGWAA